MTTTLSTREVVLVLRTHDRHVFYVAVRVEILVLGQQIPLTRWLYCAFLQYRCVSSHYDDVQSKKHLIPSTYLWIYLKYFR